VVLPSIELVAIPAFGIGAFQTGDPTERLLRLTIVGIVAVMLAVRTLLAIADSEALLARADTDPLTGLHNHRLFHGRLNAEIDRASRHGESVGLVALDVDDFGAVNSVGGHQAGDAALVGIARAIEAVVRSQDVVCRVGGDEVMVILPGADLGAAFVTARRIVEGIRCVETDSGPPLSVSAGVTAYPEHALDRDRLLAAADAALYWAKRHGKDRAVIYDDQVATPVTPEQRIKELREHANLESVRALAAAVDARDPGTRDHSRNVSVLASRLARDLGLSGEVVTLIGYAGQLHDVGKIGVPDSVLRKSGVLTEEERRGLWEHASLGAQIIASTNIGEIQPWVRHHHERWDGSGYPDGLAGEDIPLGARILALAEAYDSLVSGRSGRQPMTPRAALQQIDLELGGKFDPVIGERFIRMVTAQLSATADGRGAL
jgi:diguanylate cyclase (GGDEF)-like protein